MSGKSAAVPEKDMRSESPKHEASPPTTSASAAMTPLQQRFAEVERKLEQAWLDACNLDHRVPANSSMSVGVDEADGSYIIYSDEQRWRLAFEELNVAIMYGIVNGAPESDERAKQAEVLWNNANLDVIEARFKDKDCFISFFQTLEKADKVFLKVAPLEAIKNMIPHLLTLHLSKEQLPNPNAPSWLQDDSLVKTARELLAEWLTNVMRTDGKEKRTTLQRVDEAMRHWHNLMTEKDPDLAAQLKDELPKDFPPIKTTESVNGREVLVSMHNHRTVLYLSWVDSETNAIMNLENFVVPAECRPTFTGDNRFIYMLPQGIDIRNVEGVSVAVAETGRLCTVPLELLPSALQDMVYKDAFIALWERETGLDFTEHLARLAEVQGSEVQLSPGMQREEAEDLGEEIEVKDSEAGDEEDENDEKDPEEHPSKRRKTG